MKIYNNANLSLKHHNAVIAIGNFDGLHLGHQKVIQEAKQIVDLKDLVTSILLVSDLSRQKE